MFKFVRGFIALSLFASMVFFGCAKEELTTAAIIDAPSTSLVENGRIVSSNDDALAKRLPPENGTCQCYYQVTETSGNGGDPGNHEWHVKVFDIDSIPFSVSPYSGFDGNNEVWFSTASSGINLPTNEEDYLPAPNAGVNDIQTHYLDLLYYGHINDNPNFNISVKSTCYTSNGSIITDAMNFYHNFTLPSNFVQGDRWRKRMCLSCRPIASHECISSF